MGLPRPDLVLAAEAVAEAFVRLHEKGLIYRGSYLVNWSPGLQASWGRGRESGPRCRPPLFEPAAVCCKAAEFSWRLVPGSVQTAVSDLEVEYSEEPGTMFYFKYPVRPRAEGGLGAVGLGCQVFCSGPPPPRLCDLSRVGSVPVAGS